MRGRPVPTGLHPHGEHLSNDHRYRRAYGAGGRHSHNQVTLIAPGRLRTSHASQSAIRARDLLTPTNRRQTNRTANAAARIIASGTATTRTSIGPKFPKRRTNSVQVTTVHSASVTAIFMSEIPVAGLNPSHCIPDQSPRES